MAYNTSLAERIRGRLAGQEGIVEKTMFGGIGFLRNGHMCVGVSKESLIVRLDPEETEQALEEPHVEPFAVGGRTMKGWVTVAQDGIPDDRRLDDWIRRATRYVATLPPK